MWYIWGQVVCIVCDYLYEVLYCLLKNPEGMVKDMKDRIITSGLLALSLFHFIDHLYTMALPPLFPIIKDEFGVGNTEVGLIITGLSLSMILFQLPFGIYSDRVGRRRILILCLILMICSTFIISLSTAFWMILIFQFVLGVGASGYHPVGISAVADLAPDGQAGSAMSLQAVGGSLGVAFTPIIIGGLASIYGWRLPLQIAAIIGLGVLLYMVYFLKETKEKEEKKYEEKMEKAAATGIALMYFFREFVFIGMSSFLPTYFVEIKGFSVAGGGFTTGIFLFSGTLAQLIGGKIADRFNPVRIIIGSNLIAAVFLFFINQFQIGGSFIYLAFVFLGFSLFISVPSVLSLVKQVGSQSGYGKAFGVNFTIASMSGMIAPVIIGYIGDSFSLIYAFNLFPLLLLLTAITMLSFRGPFHS